MLVFSDDFCSEILFQLRSVIDLRFCKRMLTNFTVRYLTPQKSRATCHFFRKILHKFRKRERDTRDMYWKDCFRFLILNHNLELDFTPTESLNPDDKQNNFD